MDHRSTSSLRAPSNLYTFCRRALLVLLAASALAIASCGSDGSGGTPVAFDFAYETLPGGNTTQTIEDDGAQLQFGNINFAGSGTLGGEPVDVSVQAHALFRDGTGPSGGSVAVTSGDGDVLVLQLESSATRVDGGARIEGAFTVVGGTGRFAGVSGGGSGTGERNAALGASVRWQVELRLEGL